MMFLVRVTAGQNDRSAEGRADKPHTEAGPGDREPVQPGGGGHPRTRRERD